MLNKMDTFNRIAGIFHFFSNGKSSCYIAPLLNLFLGRFLFARSLNVSQVLPQSETFCYILVYSEDLEKQKTICHIKLIFF